MLTRFVIEFELEGGLWHAKSRELDCNLALPDLKAICEDIPNIVALVAHRRDDEMVKANS
jgi:hypothetical protein